MTETEWTRRRFLQTTALTGGCVAGGVDLATLARAEEAAPASDDAAMPPVAVTLNVNGAPYPLTLDPRTTLLDALGPVDIQRSQSATAAIMTMAAKFAAVFS